MMLTVIVTRQSERQNEFREWISVWGLRDDEASEPLHYYNSNCCICDKTEAALCVVNGKRSGVAERVLKILEENDRNNIRICVHGADRGSSLIIKLGAYQDRAILYSLGDKNAYPDDIGKLVLAVAEATRGERKGDPLSLLTSGIDTALPGPLIGAFIDAIAPLYVAEGPELDVAVVWLLSRFDDSQIEILKATIATLASDKEQLGAVFSELRDLMDHKDLKGVVFWSKNNREGIHALARRYL